MICITFDVGLFRVIHIGHVQKFNLITFYGENK